MFFFFFQAVRSSIVEYNYGYSCVIANNFVFYKQLS